MHIKSVLVGSTLALLLASCGGNLGTGNTNAKLLAGTVSALASDYSSLTVAGQTVKLSSGAALQAQAAGGKSKVRVNGKDGTPKALAVGKRVQVLVDDNGNASDVDIALELKGAIQAVDATAGTITVADKTVVVGASTRIDLHLHEADDASTSHSIADLIVGAFVEVTGDTDASGKILASKIEVRSKAELQDAGEDDHTEFKGAVAGLSGSSFTLGKFTVNCASPCVLPSGLKDGDLVEVDGTLDAAGTTLTAARVRLEHDMRDGAGEDHHAPNGAKGVFVDDLSDLNASAKTFKLEGYTVDYASATVTGTLANGAVVKVEGSVDASNLKLFHASAVTVVSVSGGERPEPGGDHQGGK